jgi:hypothetical protein
VGVGGGVGVGGFGETVGGFVTGWSWWLAECGVGDGVGVGVEFGIGVGVGVGVGIGVGLGLGLGAATSAGAVAGAVVGAALAGAALGCTALGCALSGDLVATNATPPITIAAIRMPAPSAMRLRERVGAISAALPPSVVTVCGL